VPVTDPPDRLDPTHWTMYPGHNPWPNGPDQRRTSGMDDALHMAPLFAGLDNDAADALRSTMTEVELARGRMLFQEGDPGDALYVMISGKIKLVRKANDGRENLLAVLGPGEMFGELSVFDPGPRSTAAMAVTKVKLLRLSQADLVLRSLSDLPLRDLLRRLDPGPPLATS